MKSNIISMIAVYLMLYSCAVQSPPTGGLSDTESPYIKEINPNNGSNNINANQSIEILFNEMIDPKTVKSSIRIFPETEIKINTFGKKVVIKPDDFWPIDLFRISILREISDFQGNRLKNCSDFTFSTSSNIPSGKINGKLYNHDKNTISEIGLYRINKEKFELVLITENK